MFFCLPSFSFVVTVLYVSSGPDPQDHGRKGAALPAALPSMNGALMHVLMLYDQLFAPCSAAKGGGSIAQAFPIFRIDVSAKYDDVY